jgi:hypothetical protein
VSSNCQSAYVAFCVINGTDQSKYKTRVDLRHNSFIAYHGVLIVLQKRFTSTPPLIHPYSPTKAYNVQIKPGKYIPSDIETQSLPKENRRLIETINRHNSIAIQRLQLQNASPEAATPNLRIKTATPKRPSHAIFPRRNGVNNFSKQGNQITMQTNRNPFAVSKLLQSSWLSSAPP